MKKLTKNELIKYYDVINDNKHLLTDENQFSHIASIVNEGELYKIGDKIYIQKRKKTKAFDSFIAISSFVTSYCRTYLIDLKEKSENHQEFSIKKTPGDIDVYYCDTDSLFLSKNGFERLKALGFIGEELGQLKNELGQDEFGNEKYGTGIFYAPKDYVFNDEIKCKGIKKNAIRLPERIVDLMEEIKFTKEEIKLIQKELKRKKQKDVSKTLDFNDNVDEFLDEEGFEFDNQLYKIGEELRKEGNYSKGDQMERLKDYLNEMKLNLNDFYDSLSIIRNEKISKDKFLIEEFESLNKAIKKGHLDRIIITKKIKIMKRDYKKGTVLDNGIIETFEV